MSETKNSGLDQYGAKAVERQQFGTAGVERVKEKLSAAISSNSTRKLLQFDLTYIANAAFWK